MRCLSLFSGIGGFDLALTRLGHKIVGACEIDKYARSVYARHFPGVRIWEDATKLNPKELPDFDILCGGFPCQAFSLAGRRLGFEDTRGTLFFEIARIAKQRRPQLLLLENVKGLLYHDNGKTFTVILSTLDELGYDVEWQVMDSQYFVPQSRERIFIVGHSREKPWEKVFPITERNQQNAGMGEQKQEKRKSIQGENCGTITASYYKGWGGSRTLIAMPVLRSNRTISYQNGRRWKNNNEVMFTLTATDRHGVYDGKNLRMLTPLECERLQGFPDGWTNGLSDTQRYKCLGNAVTVPVIDFIARRFTN